jgi:uncharacterized protein YkwD
MNAAPRTDRVDVTPHMPRIRSVLVFGALLVTFVAAGPTVPAHAAGLRGRMLHLVNRTRANHDLHRLRLNRSLSHQAHHHSARMAARGTIFHTPGLERRVRRFGATSWGENVAKAGTLRRVRRMWMASPDHRYNMLYRAYDHAGVGVVRTHRWLWVTVIFYGR